MTSALEVDGGASPAHVVEPSFLAANLAQMTVNLLFGVASVVAAFTLRGADAVNPFAFGAARAALTCAALGAALAWRGGAPRVPRVPRADLPRFAAASFCLFVGEFFYILGVRYAGSIRASLWQPSQPLWTLGITAALGRERLTWPRALGVALAFGGCAAMILGKAGGAGGRAYVGDACLLVNCSLGTPCYIVAVQPLLARHAPLAAAAVNFAFNTGFFLAALAAAAAAARGADPPLFARPSPPALLGIAYVALLATALPYVLQLRAAARLPASLVSAYYVLQPVAATAVVYALLGSGVRSPALARARASDLFGFLVLAGLAVVVRDARATDRSRPPDANEERNPIIDAGEDDPGRGEAVSV